MNIADRAGRRVCFVYNPAAGRGHARGLAHRLAAAAQSAGWASMVRTTQRAGQEVALARAAQAEGWPFIVAVGGDGTVHGVANGLLENGRPVSALGIVPTGSGNDFADMAALAPGNLETNVTRTLAGEVRHFDVGSALDEYFVNGMGIGFDAEVVRQILRPSRLRGFSLYLAAVYRTFWRFRAPTLEVLAGEFHQALPMMMLEISIGQRAGGGFRLTPTAAPDDGLFDICAIREVGWLQFLRYLPRVVRGTHGGLPPVSLLQAAEVTVRADPTPIAIHMDGELRQPRVREIVARVVPAALPVVCAS